jgi:hypothetical protein|tara:strand:- start:631 stop:1308 length:678 start_codon:yes stop_codon:yes gene_type:complete
MSYECKFCKKIFGSERTLLSHLCEPKRRWNNRKEKNVQLAFRCFQHFFRITATNMKSEKTYDDFMTSKYYLAFVKFANYIMGVYISNVETYIEWLLKQRIRIDKWSTDQVYESYIKEFNFRESVDRAVERTVIELKNWSEESNKPWNSFFKEVSQPRAIHMIRAGKISPWIVYNSQSGLKWLDSLNDEQMIMINDYINPTQWSKRFSNSPEDVRFVLDITKKAEL